jgi:ketosteroid isomerase-like protein
MPEQTATPQELFARFQRNVLDGGVAITEDMCAEDIVVESPFASGGSRRIEGREAFLSLAEEGRAALDVRFEGFSDVVIHQTADPEVIVAEYVLTGTAGAAGRTASSAFVLVMRARDGRIVHWREYQDVAAMKAALGD